MPQQSWKDAMLETGIDKLLSIVSEKGRVSAKDAAKSLSVSLDTIESWADILEKENLMSREYTPSGAVILTNTAKNTVEKEKRADELKDDISVDLKEIEAGIREKEEALRKEHKKIAGYEAILIRESGESEKLGKQLSALSAEGENIKRAFNLIAAQERRISDDARSIGKIIDDRMVAVKKLESELKKFEEEKQKIVTDIELLEKISAAIQKEPANRIYAKIDEIERKAKEVRESNRKLGERYSIVQNLLDKVH